MLLVWGVMRILQIGYFPVKHPVTGGQRRIIALQKVFTSLQFDSRYVGIYPNRNDGAADDICLTPAATEFLFRIPHDFEMRLSDVFAADTGIVECFEKKISDYRPNVIWLEHPFLWPALKPLIRRMGVATVYSSHNVEWKMKGDYLRLKGINDRLAVINLKECELDLVKNSDLVVACCRDDASYFEAMGGQEVIEFPNGSDIPPDLTGTSAIENLFHSYKLPRDTTYFIYVSSNHEPNWLGLEELIIEPLLRLAGKYAVKLLLVGGYL